MKRPLAHAGYVFLVTVLVLGTVAATTALSELLLGWAAEENGNLLVQSTQAVEYARTCAERTLRSLRLDPTYGGEETIALTRGSCTVRPVGGVGNFDRTVCVSGASGLAVRRFEIVIAQLFPTVVIGSWREVSSFSLCP